MSEAEYNKTRIPYGKISKGRLEAIKKLLGSYEGKTIIDIGCGAGELGRLLKAEKQCTVYGVDVSKNAVEKARGHLDEAWVADISEGVFPNELNLTSVDIIVISEVLEHLFDPGVLLREIRKKTNAPIVITVPNILFWKNRLRILFGSFRYTLSGLMDWGHIRFFTNHTLKELLGVSGYEVIQTAHIIPTRGTRILGIYFPTFFARQFAVHVEVADTVVYTAIFGGYDTLAPVEPQKGVSFVCITDNDQYQVPGWNMWYMQPPQNDTTRSARFCKVNPHLLFPHIQQSIWIDGNIHVCGDVQEAIKKYLSDTNMAVYDHTYTQEDIRGSVYEEADVLIFRSENGRFKDNPQTMKEQMNKYRESGYLDDQGLISSMIMFRRHNDPEIVCGMQRWWNEIKNGSKRDQLSFNYAMWKEGVSFDYIQEDSRDNAYFKHVPHKKKDI